MKQLIPFFLFLISVLAFDSCDKDTSSGTLEPSIVYPINEFSDDYTFDQSKVTNIEFQADNTVKIIGLGATSQASKVTITAGGNYALSGTTTDGQLLVDVTDTVSVKIVMNNVNITSKTSSAIYVKAAKKVILITAEGSINKLADGANYVFDDVAAQEPSGTIFSKEDLTFFGNGTLDVVGNFQDGIVSKDGIIVKSGTIKVNAKDDAIRGKNYVIIRDGNLDLTAQQDGLKSSGLPEDGLGFIIIDNGTLNVSAGDDGIHGEYYITINNGTINVKKSREAIEARKVTVNDGNISINATNDGFNCSDGLSDSPNALTLIINGGYLVARVSAGDVYDANGNININGGTVIAHGPASGDGEVLDHDAEFNITGGIFVGTGGKIRSDFVGSKSTQNILAVTFSGNTQQKPLLMLKRSDGKEVVTFQVENGLQSFVYSSPDLIKDNFGFLSGGTLSSGVNMDGLVKNAVVTGNTKLFDFDISGLVTVIKK